MSKRKNTFVILASLILILVMGRLYFPYWLKDYVNHQLSQLDGHSGNVKDIDVYLWRGAYKIQSLVINKADNNIEEPFVKINEILLSVDWKALFNGAIVAEVDLYDAHITFAKTQTGEGGGWVTLVDALSPLAINRFEIHGGQLKYVDYTVSPEVNLFIKDIKAKINNLRQVERETIKLPSSLAVSGSTVGNGSFNLAGSMDILKSTPDFDMGLEIRDADLTAFNDYAKSVANIDFERGSIGIFAELAAAEGSVTGYVKPVATNVEIIDVSDDGTPLNLLWESTISFFTEIFENQKKDQFALRIPLEGSLQNPSGDFWTAFLSIFNNAFAQAFSKNEDGTIDFSDAIKQNNQSD